MVILNCGKNVKIESEVNFMNNIKVNKVRAFREALGKTQGEMSELLGISQPSYNRKEKNRNFSDVEKITLTKFFKEFFKDETLESIFF